MSRSHCLPTAAATTSLGDAAARVWDVVVAGAGPAGALVARALAAQGVAVLLVDKASFPREKVCGSCLNGAALAALDAAGLADLPQRLGAVPLTHMRLHSDRRSARLALPVGVALSRWALDAALVEKAVASGVALLSNTEAQLEPTAGPTRKIHLRSAGNTAVVETRIAIAADGLSGSLLKHTPGMEPLVLPTAPVGVGAVLEADCAAYEPGTIYMACNRNGYVGAVRLEDGRLDVAAAMNPGWMPSVGGPAAAVAAILRGAGLPDLALESRAHFRGTVPLSRRRPRVAAVGLFVLGDAAGYLEPFTGEGMSWAMQQALLVAPLAAEAICEPSMQHAQRWQRQYEQFIQRRRRVCQAAIWMRRHLALGSLVIGLLGRFPGLAAPLMRAINRPFPDLPRRRAS